MNLPTPLVPLTHYDPNLYAKLEYLHPSGSMKHRSIPNLIAHLLETGEIESGQRLVIRSAGSAAVTLAWVGAELGYPVTAVLPLHVAQATLSSLHWLGAECQQLSPAEATVVMASLAADPATYVVAQANEPRLIEHYRVVAAEIFEQVGTPTAITVGIGTGLSVMGIAVEARCRGAETQVWGVEPAEAAIASGQPWAPHRIPGLAPPIPQPLLDTSALAGILALPSVEAWRVARDVARGDGLLIGPSAGVAVAAAVHLRNQGVRGPIVAICASSMADYWEGVEDGLEESSHRGG